MDKFDRIFQLHGLFSGRRIPVPLEEITSRLECSKSTFYRLIRVMRDYLRAPIERDPETGGYHYVLTKIGGTYELPGLWFSAHELQSLVVLQKLLSGLEPGFLEEQLSPLARRLDELVQHKRLQLGETASRVRILSLAARSIGESFRAAASATLQRHKLRLRYHSRSKNERTERVVSPQRLVHYRDNWYLDAWDDLPAALRTFSIDRIIAATELQDAAHDVSSRELDDHLASAYGIFSGKANKTAVLRFSPARARWVADERWHPRQVGRFQIDGSFELDVPYRDSRELVMDILRHGAEVEVVSPETLRVEVRQALEHAIAKYTT